MAKSKPPTAKPKPRSPSSSSSSSLVGLVGGGCVLGGALLWAAHAHLWSPPTDPNVLCTSPRIWLQPDFLSAAEVDRLLGESARQSNSQCWETVSSTQRTAMLESCPALASSPLMQEIDRRVSEAFQVNVSHLEHGYLQEYRPGYEPHNVHLDQGEAMVPARTASAIVYLDDQPVGSGHTVFPLARLRGELETAQIAEFGRTSLRAARAVWETLRGERALEEGVGLWNPKLRAGRITSRFFKPHGYGASLFQLGADHCARGLGVRPTRGTALFFEGRSAGTNGGERAETIEAAHGSCGLPAHGTAPKRVLVKLACDGEVR